MTRGVLVCFIIFLVLVGGCATAVAASPTPLVYDDQVCKPWSSFHYSWDCTANYASSPGATGAHAIRATLDGWGGIAFATKPCLGTQHLVALTFQIRGQAGGEHMRVSLFDANGAELPRRGGLQLGPYVAGGVTTGWKTVTIPLRAFGAEGKAISKLAFISDEKGSQTIYLDTVRFVAAH